MKNLIKTITTEQIKYLEDFKKEIKKVKEISELDKWQYKDLLPKGKNIKEMILKDAKIYLILRKEKQINKRIEEEINSIKNIFDSGKFLSAKISIEWKSSRTWKSNPRAEGWVRFLNKDGQSDSIRVQSDSICGCGYDKLSTAVAQVINQMNPILKLLYTFKNKNINEKNHEVFSYGAGYGILPKIEGGVGISCYNTIFNKIGFTFKSIASGKSFDVFTIEKSKK